MYNFLKSIHIRIAIVSQLAKSLKCPQIESQSICFSKFSWGVCHIQTPYNSQHTLHADCASHNSYKLCDYAWTCSKCSVQNLPDQYKIASSAPGIVHYIQKYISQKTYSDFAKAITWPCHNSDLQTIVLCITLGVQKSQSCSHIPIFSSATSNCYHKMLEFFVLSLQKLIYYCNH